MVYLSLFVSAFLAATLLPVVSELHLAALLQQPYSVLGLFLAASAGNTLGAVVNYCIGLELQRFQHKRWFPVKPSQLVKAQAVFQRYGVWSLLFAWLPFIGDPLTFVAGILRIRFWLFLLLVATGKSARYGVIILGARELWF